MSKELAKAVLKAVELHEASFDIVGADAAFAEYAKGHRSIMPVNSDFYRKSLRRACVESCDDDPELAGAVYLLLAMSWNDALDWARGVAKSEGNGSVTG